MDEREAILELRGLRKTFGAIEVLRGIDLSVTHGEVVFIIGPSGSGKSTLLRCCNRLEEPTSGSIRVDGEDILARSVDINAVRRRMGMVFQSFNLYPHMTALGNVTLALRQGAPKLSRDEAAGPRASAALAARRAGSKRQASFPNGALRRSAATRGDRPRPGTRSRSIMLFDEPTSGARPGARRQRAER